MSDRKILIIVMSLVVVLVVGGGTGFQAWRTHRPPRAYPQPAYAQGPRAVVAGQPVRLGQSGAPVTVTLYEDFHCPHCVDFETSFAPTLDAAQQRGVVALEVYPMSFIDAGSTSAANAMACATAAGFGASFYAGLFANHTLQWSAPQLVALAGLTGAAVTPEFTRCVDDDEQRGWVDSINTAADANGVQGTPTMFLDAAPVDIATLTPATLDAMISEAAKQ